MCTSYGWLRRPEWPPNLVYYTPESDECQALVSHRPDALERLALVRRSSAGSYPRKNEKMSGGDRVASVLVFYQLFLDHRAVLNNISIVVF